MHHHLRNLDLNLLLIFDAVWRHRSVSRAASELAMSNSALSHALSRLRRSLDDELFYRAGHEMQPTLFAVTLAEAISNSLLLLNQSMQRTPRFNPAVSRHEFVFAVTDFTLFSVFPALIGKVQQTAPDIRFQLINSERKVALNELMAGRIDFALGFTESHDRRWPDIDELDWMQDDYVVIASPRYFSPDSPIDPERYLSARHLVVTPWNEDKGYIDSELDKLGLARQIVMRTPSVMTAPFIIAESPLLLTLPRYAAERLLPSAAFTIHPLPFDIPPYQVKIYSWQKNSQREACRWLLAQLQTIKEGERSERSTGSSR